jgi:1-phosphofructokinase family hexose kinase
MKIVTITLNPAIDLHIAMEKLIIGEDNSANITARHSGGKGVNLSRALHVNGVKNTCYMVLGEQNADEFIAPLVKLGMEFEYDTTTGCIRENINLHFGKRETVIATSGPKLDCELLSRVRKRLEGLVDKDTAVAFTGRISEGTDKAAIIDMLTSLKGQGAKLILDSKSIDKDDIEILKPYLIKPNESEAEELVGIKVDTVKKAALAAEKIRELGVEKVMVSLGSEGLLFMSDEGVFHAVCEKIDPLSTVGAGDSTIAGFLKAKALGLPDEMATAHAAAFGTAACLCAGTEPPSRKNVERMLETVKITKM